MSVSRTGEPIYETHLHPVHAILLGFLFPLTLGAALSDWLYSSTYQVQWLNFSDWLIAGSLVGGVLALVWAAVGLLVSRNARGRGGLFILLLAPTIVVNFLNSLTHAKDAYATMPMGLILSVIGTLLALVTSVIGFSGRSRRSA